MATVADATERRDALVGRLFLDAVGAFDLFSVQFERRDLFVAKLEMNIVVSFFEEKQSLLNDPIQVIPGEMGRR